MVERALIQKGQEQTAFFHPQSAKARGSLGALVTDLDQRILVNVTELSLHGQRQSADPYNTRLFGDIVNGAASCQDCARLVLSPYPGTATRITVDVVLPASVLAAFVYLVSYDLS